MSYIFRVAAAQLFGRELGLGPLPMRVLRNADFQEVSLEVDGRPVLRFALAYGFRNIQTLVRHSPPGLKLLYGVCELSGWHIMLSSNDTRLPFACLRAASSRMSP